MLGSHGCSLPVIPCSVWEGRGGGGVIRKEVKRDGFSSFQQLLFLPYHFLSALALSSPLRFLLPPRIFRVKGSLCFCCLICVWVEKKKEKKKCAGEVECEVRRGREREEDEGRERERFWRCWWWRRRVGWGGWGVWTGASYQSWQQPIGVLHQTSP